MKEENDKLAAGVLEIRKKKEKLQEKLDSGDLDCDETK